MIKIENQKSLNLKIEKIESGRKFLTELLEYIRTNSDTQKYHEKDEQSYNPFIKTYSMGCSWTSGDVFNIEFTNEVELDFGKWLEFKFRRLKHYWKEDGLLENGEIALKYTHELQPTGLIFYVQYMGDNFNIRSNNATSHEANDFGFVTNEIAKELAR